MKKRATIVIPNYNGAKLLSACLDSLSRQTFRDFGVLVVDNGSTDDSAALCERRSGELSLLRKDSNLGFAAAANEGIRNSDGELVALLNNDTETDPDWLLELVAALDRRSDIAFCASRMLDLSDRSLIDSAGNCYAFNGRSIPRGFLERDAGQYEKEEEVFGACAGAALYRRSLFDEIGVFDESFVSYKEDVDLDFRAQLRGFRCLYVPGAICYHVGGATSGRRRSDLAVRLSACNSIITFVKNMPGRFLPRALPRMLLDTLFQAGYQVVKGRQAGPLIKGICKAAGQIPYALGERRKIQASADFDPEHLYRLLMKGDAEVKLYRKRCRAAEG